MEFLGNLFLDSLDEKVTLEKSKIILLYFSSFYCPPCKNFLPILTDIYEEWNTKNLNNKIEIIFCSWDKNIDEYKKYKNKMPWISLPYNSNIVDNLVDKFDVKGIPYLIALKNDGSLITNNARKLILEKGVDLLNEWIN